MRPGLVQLVADSVVYAGTLVLRRALSLVTLPVLTRALGPAELGVVAVLGTVRELLGVVFQLGVPNAADRFAFACAGEAERRRLYGTLAGFLMGATLAGSLLLLWLGPPLWARLAPGVPFHPYVSLTVATVFMAGIGVIPRSIFRVSGRSGRYAALSLAQGVLVAGLVLLLVVGGRLGVLGVVLAELAGAAVFFSSTGRA